jgi:hypothetical protein
MLSGLVLLRTRVVDVDGIEGRAFPQTVLHKPYKLKAFFRFILLSSNGFACRTMRKT